MNRTRAYRRYEREKAIARATKRAKDYHWRYSTNPEDYFIWVRRSATTPHPCSDHCCGNPRRFGGKDRFTMQERRYLEGQSCQY